MRKNSLVVLNIGFIFIMLSALGEGMEINYLTLTTGVTFAGIGAVMFFRSKNKKSKEEESET